MSAGCRSTMSSEGQVCALHGGAWTAEAGCVMRLVLADVAAHRAEQFARFGANRPIPDGTGPSVEWLAPLHGHAPWKRFDASQIEAMFREEWDYDVVGHEGASWMRMVREEVSEAFGEDDQDRLYAEVTQVAALCVAWMEKIRERRLWQYGHVTSRGGVFAAPDWLSPADVMREQHGHHRAEPVTVMRRRPGGPWEAMPDARRGPLHGLSGPADACALCGEGFGGRNVVSLPDGGWVHHRPCWAGAATPEDAVLQAQREGAP